MKQPPTDIRPMGNALIELIAELGQTASPETFQQLLTDFIREHTGLETWLGIHEYPHEGRFVFSCHPSPAPFETLNIDPDQLPSLFSGQSLLMDQKSDHALAVMPVLFGKKIIALLASPSASHEKMCREEPFFQQLSALTGLVIHHFFIRQDLEKRKNEMELKVFELALLEEVGTSLSQELDTVTIGRKLLLCVTGYLTATSACFYIHKGKSVFSRVAHTGTPLKSLPMEIALPEEPAADTWPRFIEKDPYQRSFFYLFLDNMGMELLFPLMNGKKMTGFVMLGQSAKNRPHSKTELSLTAAMISQALSPLRNAALYTDLKKNNEALGKSLECLKQEMEEKQQTQEKLLEYQGVVAASQDPVALIDHNLKLIMVNRACAHAFGTLPEKLIGKTITSVTDTELFHKKLKEPLMRCLAGETVRFRFSWSFPEWGLRHVDVAVYPYQGPFQKKSAAIFILRDITQMQEMENRLLQSQKMEAIGTLAGGIAHDFNNILAGIMGYTELSMARLERDHTARDFMEKAVAACKRASDLVKQILSFSRGDSAHINMRPLCLTEITEDALKLLRASLPAPIEITLSRKEAPLPVLGNATQLHQVIMNLCTNAAHAMPNGGTITIGLQHIGTDHQLASLNPAFKKTAYAELMVKDHGSGIPEACISRIFEPFFTTKAQGKGTGMGLSISHGIIGNHGGLILVDSQPGKGSTFRVFLPLAEEAATTPRNEPAPAMPRGNRERILLVEDEPDLLQLCAEILSGLGYEVRAVSRPEHALKIFKQNPENYDLIISDQMMPRMTGVNLAQHMLALRPELPFLLCSGFSEALSPDILETMGIRSFLMKPFTRSQLATAVRHLLDECPFQANP
ncbi:PAS domain S-box-containing protein [Desulfobotulus alkaliphilus]|uniref:histidine kinase n=1 Tax=Desulfobotulus alkaliphilus TaxID=622671 RepID=A0A562S7K3_9BACT|nr:ATP-binding protein [Desulfobotulus alkaliphilus]TWI77392.1 PAS domain S-box-containing protein [Desulfobotulus alkaliphilus]